MRRCIFRLVVLVVLIGGLFVPKSRAADYPLLDCGACDVGCYLVCTRYLNCEALNYGQYDGCMPGNGCDCGCGSCNGESHGACVECIYYW